MSFVKLIEADEHVRGEKNEVAMEKKTEMEAENELPSREIENDDVSIYLQKSAPPPPSGESSGILCTAKRVLRNVTVEPFVFLAILGQMMQSIVVQSLVFDQTCLVTMNYDESYCQNVTNRTDLETVEGVVSDYNLYADIILQLPFIFMAPLLGPFCDTHGPKLLIVVSLLAHIMSEAIFITISAVRYLPPSYTLIGHAMKGIVGGFRTFFLGIDTFIVVNTSVQSRTTRMALLEVAVLLGGPIGALLGGFIYGRGNYILVFAISASFTILSLLWTLVVFRNKPFIVKDQKIELTDVLKWKSIITNFQVFTKHRSGRRHIYVVIATVCAKLMQLPHIGKRTMLYPFTQLQFGFTVKDFSNYEAYVMGLNCLGVMVFIPILSYYLKIGDLNLVISIVLITAVAETLIAFASNSVWFYIASSLLLFTTASHIISRSIMSKCVNKNEQGRLLSVYAMLSAGIPTLMAFIYNRIFHASMSTFPSASFLLTSAIYLLPAAGFTWMLIDLKKHSSEIQHNRLVEIELHKNNEEPS